MATFRMTIQSNNTCSEEWCYSKRHIQCRFTYIGMCFFIIPPAEDLWRCRDNFQSYRSINEELTHTRLTNQLVNLFFSTLFKVLRFRLWRFEKNLPKSILSQNEGQVFLDSPQSPSIPPLMFREKPAEINPISKLGAGLHLSFFSVKL